MDYEFNPSQWTRIFAVPSSVAENYLKLAEKDELKVLLYITYNINRKCSVAEIAEYFDISEETVEDALLFWKERGVLSNGKENTFTVAVKEEKKEDAPKPRIKTTERKELTPSEIAERITNSEEIRFLFEKAENICSRMLTHTDQRALVWIHDYMGLSSDVIIMLLQHCREVDKLSASYIESVAKSWCEKGITDAKSAEEEIARMSRFEFFSRKIKRIFGIEARNLSTKEKNFAEKWLCDDFSEELISYAFDKNIDATGKLSFAYIDKILISWKEKGYTDRESVEKGESETKPESKGYKVKKTYDYDTLAQIALNSGGNNE